MPYIPKKDRETIEIIKLDKVGKLTYLLTLSCNKYLARRGQSYQTYNDIIGALECCKLEMYRRRIAEYEDQKRKINGDV